MGVPKLSLREVVARVGRIDTRAEVGEQFAALVELLAGAGFALVALERPTAGLVMFGRGRRAARRAREVMQ